MRAGPSVDVKVINVGKKHNTGDTGGHSSLTALDTGELGAGCYNGKMLEASLAEERQHN